MTEQEDPAAIDPHFLSARMTRLQRLCAQAFALPDGCAPPLYSTS